MTWRAVLVGAVLHAGCGHGASHTDAEADADIPGDDDATMTGPCWNPVDPIAKGEAVIGTGYDQFLPMPSDLPIEFGSQNGFNIVANVQMKGLAPGNPADIFNPSNPRTRILSYFVDDGRPLNKAATCPFRVGYRPVGPDTYEMASGVAIIFDTCWRAEHLIGRQLRIKLELLDATNGYITSERVVTMLEPTGGYPKNEGQPGCAP